MQEATERERRIRQMMERHVAGRLAKALKRWGGRGDSLARDERKKAEEKYKLNAVIEKGRAASNRIAVATHIAKAMHPELKAKDVTNIFVDFDLLASIEEVGSHVLRDSYCLADTTGDGAYNNSAYELYLLLECQFEGRSLGGWLAAQDSEAVAAFAVTGMASEQRLVNASEISALLKPKRVSPASHVKSKQLYWLAGGDANDNMQYHLLAPLYPASLVHAVYGVLQEHRFGDVNNAARSARQARKEHKGVLHEYPDLAVQKLGGTKPQNISQLNSERGGVNYLLASLPPRWHSRKLRQPWGVTSVIDQMLLHRDGVRPTLHALLRFLLAQPPSNADTRDRVDGYVSSLIDELVILATELQRGWPDGWTADVRCELALEEQLWLDPARAEDDEAFRLQWMQMDWPAQVGHRFGNWLNAQLSGRLPVGEAEQRQWRKELLVDESEHGWAQRLHEARTHLDAPHYIPTRMGAI